MRGRGRWLALSVLLAALLVSVLAALVATRYYPAYRGALAARDDLREAQALLRARRLDASAADLAAAEARLIDAEAGFRRARRAFDDPLLEVGQRLPLVGGSLQATVGLAEIGLEGALLGRDAVAVSRTYQRRRDRGQGSLTEQANELLAEIDPSMATIRERLSLIHEERLEVTAALLPPALAAAVRELDDDLAELDELVRTYDDLSAFIPDFLGFNGPRTYLVLAQNNAELLPTGGLISVYGVITIEDGRIVEKHFGDAVAYGGRWLERSGAYIEPPPPLRRYLLKDVSWNFALSNWSPHFPSAAREAERFFRLAGGPPVDGVIAINVRTIEELLRVTGPVRVESYEVMVSADNALEVIEEHTRSALEPEQDRKAFVGLLAEELLSRLMRASAQQWTPLVEALERLRDQRQLLFFSDHPGLQERVRSLGLDGALEQPDGDYVMLVDASVHSTKLNIVLEQRIDLTVQIDALGGAHHRLSVTYHNDLPAWSQGRDPDLVRRLMLSGRYGGYVRLLAPGGSRVQSVALAGREVGPEAIETERSKAVFGRYFALRSGEQAELAFGYTTPAVARPEGELLVYRLYLQKQPGTDAIPVGLQIILPAGARLHSADLDGRPVASVTRVETDLAEDRELVVRYRLGR